MQITVCIGRDLHLPHILVVETVFLLLLPLIHIARMRTVIYEIINVNLSFSVSLQASMPFASIAVSSS
jgi:hypothetical protein